MILSPRMLREAEEALGHEVERDWLVRALEHHALDSLADLVLMLRWEEKEFARKRGRDVDQAEYIDGLRAVIAIRKLPRDPKNWCPRRT